MAHECPFLLSLSSDAADEMLLQRHRKVGDTRLCAVTTAVKNRNLEKDTGAFSLSHMCSLTIVCAPKLQQKRLLAQAGDAGGAAGTFAQAVRARAGRHLL